MGPRSFQIWNSGPKIWSAPTKTDPHYNFCVINFFPSLTVEAVDALQTLFRAPWPLGSTPGGQNIAYDLALVKLGPHTKFGEDWSNGVDFYTGHTHTNTHTHTHTHTDSTLYIRFLLHFYFSIKQSLLFLQPWQHLLFLLQSSTSRYVQLSQCLFSVSGYYKREYLCATI